MPDNLMMAQRISAANINTTGMYMMQRANDPVLQALRQYNVQNTAHATPVSQVEPTNDALSYDVEGSPQKLSRPFLRIQQMGPPLPSPAVRFTRKDDGVHLSVTFEEDPTLRPANALPFNVTIRTVQLKFGAAPDQALVFDTILQEPLPTAAPDAPAFTVVADAKVPDERLDVIVRALRTGGSALWQITMDFPWVQTIPQTPSAPAAPGAPAAPLAAVGFRQMRRFPLGGTADPAPIAVNFLQRDKFQINRDWLIHVIHNPPPPPPLHVTKTIVITRQLSADYPTETSRNRPVFAAVLDDSAEVPWSNTAFGYYLPTPIQDTIYCVPDAFRLQVDPLTGRPAIQMTLLKGDTDDDPKNYKIRCTMAVRPDFDPVRIDSLRTLVRGQFQMQFAHLMLGGYKSASFKADEALAGLGEMFSGHSADDKTVIDPINGFSLTYEGRAEFINDLTERLKSTGIGGQVILQLDQPGDQDLSLSIPVILTLRQMATAELPTQFSPVSTDGQPEDGLPRAFQIRNPTSLPMKLASIQAYALQKSPVTGITKDWCHASPVGATLPATLNPDGELNIVFALDKPDGLFNAWNVDLIGASPAPTGQFLLDLLLDHATQSVNGWKVDIDCPPLQFFDQLTPDQQLPFKDVIACDVQVKRKIVNPSTGDLLDTTIMSARLTRQVPASNVLLSLSVADFIHDHATGNNLFLWRRRYVRILNADDWGDWHEETGAHATIY